MCDCKVLVDTPELAEAEISFEPLDCLECDEPDCRICDKAALGRS